MENNRFFWDSRLAMWLEDKVESLACWITTKRYPSALNWSEPISKNKQTSVADDPYAYSDPSEVVVSTPISKKSKKKAPAKKKKAKKV